MKKPFYCLLVLLTIATLCSSHSVSRQNTIDLELSVTTNRPDIEQWESSKFTYTLENKGITDATGVEVRLYYQEKVVPVGGTVVFTSSGNYATVPDEQFINIGLWKNITVPAGGSASLEIELFSKAADLSFCAEVTASDQEDTDSMPSISACTSGEDDETNFSKGVSACGFFRTYPGLTPMLDEVMAEETEDAYLLQNSEIRNRIDKQGNLLSSESIISEPSPNFSVEIAGNEVQFIKINPEGDTLFNEAFIVDYDNPTAIVQSSPIITVSDGLVFGGFIVDFDSNQSFRGFVIKTDLNGQSPQFIIVDDIDDTLGFRTLLEDSQGNLYPYWAGAGNFSISRISTDFSSAWASQFAADTPSTDTEDIKLSIDEQKIYVAVTDNLRAIVYAFDTETGEDVTGGFELIDWIPPTGAFQNYRSNGLLPLNNGNLLFASRFFGSSNEERFDYSLFDSKGELIWTQSIEGAAFNLRPVAQTDDGSFLFVNEFSFFTQESQALQILKTNEVGEQLPACNAFEDDVLIDLELSISAEDAAIPIWTSQQFTLTLVNNGPDEATNVEVQLPIEVGRFVEVGESMPVFSKGNYYQGVWNTIDLAAGESTTLQIDIFNKSEALELFAQVTQADQRDVDSEPFNAVCCLANEDDEAVFVSSNENFRTDNAEQRSIETEITIYPNPTNSFLQIKNITTQTTYQIHDILGRILMQGQVNNSQIDVCQLESGTYFLNFLGENRTVIRFVKH